MLGAVSVSITRIKMQLDESVVLVPATWPIPKCVNSLSLDRHRDCRRGFAVAASQ